MGFFGRLGNLWSGFWSLWVSDAEARNPAAVYESAINERINKHKELKKAVAGIIYMRNKLQGEMEEKSKKLAEIQQQIPVAVDEGEDEVALVLLEQEENLSKELESLTAELSKVEVQADDAKASLVQFKAEIEKLRREKDAMLAKKANAEARLKIQESLSGLSTDDDIKALENVRESIHKTVAEADITAEMEDASLDKKLAEIKAKTANASARSRLDALKAQRAAQQSQGGGVKKTM